MSARSHSQITKTFWLLVAALALASTAPAREWTDSTGKFKVEAELVAVRNGKAILEKPDGSVITVPVEKLSTADQEYLRKQAAPTPAEPARPVAESNPFASPSASAPPAAAATAPAPITAQGAELAQKVQGVLRANCYRCHGEDGASEGGFNFVLNLEKLSRTVVKPRQPAGSQLYARISATDENRMPPEGEDPRPSAGDIALVKAWIEAGAPALAIAKPREFLSNDAIVKYILSDVRQASERSRRFMRYFTLTHLYNAGVSEDELQTYRNAFTKLINSLSWNTDLILPQALDPQRTVFRVDMRALNWSGETWEAIEKANPYFLAQSTPDALSCNEFTQTNMPYVRIDWFVFAASKPPLYHTILQIPATDRELESMLRVNVESNIEQEKAIRAAFNRSGVSQNNRLIEWHKSPYGSYWKSYDFGGSTGRQNLFEHPLGPGNAAEAFQHDGGEIVFTLPNGLQGYMLVDGHGNRIDQGPTSIVSDPKRLDRTVTNGVSCMSCHYTGVIPKADEVGPAVRANPKAFTNSADILALYREPAELNRIQEGDGGRFAAALKKIGINSLSRSGEAVSAMAMRFQQEIDMPMVASEFGLTPGEFNERMNSAESTARAFAPLRIPGGTLKRDVFVSVFGQAAIELRLVSSATRPSVTSAPALRSVASATGSSSSAATTLPRPSDANKPGEVCRFNDMGWGVESLAFSPSGTLLAAGKPDRALWLFDVSTRARVQSLDRLEILNSVTACAFTPSGTQLLAGGGSGHIRIFDVSREGILKEAGQFAGHSNDVQCISISGDGKFAVSGGDEKKLRYWEIAAGQERAVFAEFQGSIRACYIAKNGRTALATDGAVLQQIDLTRREVTRRRPLNRSPAAGRAAAFSADGNFVAAVDGYKIRVWNLSSTGEMPPLEDNESQWTIAFTPDGSRLLAGGSGKVNVWDYRKQRKVYSLETAKRGYIQCLAVSPDSKHVAAIPSSAGQDLQVFRLPP